MHAVPRTGAVGLVRILLDGDAAGPVILGGHPEPARGGPAFIIKLSEGIKRLICNHFKLSEFLGRLDAIIHGGEILRSPRRAVAVAISEKLSQGEEGCIQYAEDFCAYPMSVEISTTRDSFVNKDARSQHTPVVVTDKKGAVAAGVKHLFEGLIHAGEQILYDVWSKLKSSLKIGGYILRGHALQQVDGATELICKVHERTGKQQHYGIKTCHRRFPRIEM